LREAKSKNAKKTRPFVCESALLLASPEPQNGRTFTRHEKCNPEVTVREHLFGCEQHDNESRRAADNNDKKMM
jgi:hypothetical protein